MPMHAVESLIFKEVKAGCSVVALLDCIVIGGLTVVLTLLHIGQTLYSGERRLNACNGSMVVFSSTLYFCIVPFVQIPLFRQAVRKLLQ
eukprot:NODE_18547_length_887_cov_4.296053.p3 GENE.NODE_18547_length_887_cov_4.296053~~NODE_18547_length_887_cov_4.296053.p3  ORF type:complete len:89 (+),score=24.96 NODE_18547_length_887_cov_4.296053:245-511(+)